MKSSPPSEDEFYWIDAVGCLVVDEAGRRWARWWRWSRGRPTTSWSSGGRGGGGVSPVVGLFFARSTRRRGGWSPLRPRGGDVRIDVLTLFPGCFPGRFPTASSAGRGAGHLAVEVHDLRPYAEGKHRVTDEPPFGGGAGW